MSITTSPLGANGEPVDRVVDDEFDDEYEEALRQELIEAGLIEGG